MPGMSTTTRNGKFLSLEQKLEVRKRVDSGESFRKIAGNFSVGMSTISDIRHSGPQLRNFVSHMDNGMHVVPPETCTRSTINGPILQEKPLIFSTKHSIRQLKLHGEKLSADNESADDDIPLFVTLTDDEILQAMKKDENEDVDVSDMSDKPDEEPSH
ncbi:hypothetical protein T10_7952 [Trichinella papuae]|uniref:HTH psq-type domain-containing protein n=1 Tax=Trichinella papuae TaxID=268474 RepID=A0A0V1MKT9_9BILA|nr:hypothetical protein T10_7952 [Trichinella papuae]